MIEKRIAKPMRTGFVVAFVALVATGAALQFTVGTASAASSASIAKNITAMQDGIVGVIKDWVPFLIAMAFLGTALAVLGIGVFGRHHGR